MSGDPIAAFFEDFGVNPEVMVYSWGGAVLALALGLGMVYGFLWVAKKFKRRGGSK